MFQRLESEYDETTNTIISNIFDDEKLIGKIKIDSEVGLKKRYKLVIDSFIECYQNNNLNVPANLMIFMKKEFYIYGEFDYLDHHIKINYPQYFNEMKKYEILL